MQNQISTIEGTSAYLKDHLILFVDGEPFDALLDRIAPGRMQSGLVPTLLGCTSDEEASVVSERILPQPGVATLAPVLMCPDDLDFSCTIVVADVVSSDEAVEWRRIGLDATPWSPNPSSRIGGKVEWLEQVGPFRFDRGEYLEVLRAFEQSPSLYGPAHQQRELERTTVREEEFKDGVREHLNRLTPDVERVLAHLISYPFVQEVKQLHFEVFSDGFTQEFPVTVYFLDEDGAEYFIEKDGKAEYPCDVDTQLLQIEHVFPVDWEETFTNEDPDLDSFTLATQALIPWFAERWVAANGRAFPRSAYIGIHDKPARFNLMRQRWED